MPTEKRCPKHNDGAGAILPASSFYTVKNRQGVPSLAGYCKDCSKTAAKKYHRDNPIKARESVRRVFQLYPEKRKEYESNRPKGYRADWARNDRRRSPLKHWKYELKKTYGVTPDWYEEKLKQQQGCCALCPMQICSNGRRLGIDHDHSTGKIRGILCDRCNSCLERIESHDGWHTRALAYLEFYKANL